MQYFPLNSSKFVSAISTMIYQPMWNQRDMKLRLMSGDQNALPPGQEKTSNAGGGGGCQSFDMTGT